MDAILVGLVPGSVSILLVGLAACTGPLGRALSIAPNLAIKDSG